VTTRRGTDDETRWADAESILDGTPTESATRRLRQFRRRTWTTLAVVLVVCLAGGGLVGWAIGSSHGHHGGSDEGGASGWVEVLGLVVVVAGVALAIAGLVRMRRAGA